MTDKPQSAPNDAPPFRADCCFTCLTNTMRLRFDGKTVFYDCTNCGISQGTDEIMAINKALAVSETEASRIAAAKSVLQGACDRDWEDETFEQTVAITANGMYWRGAEISNLKRDLAKATANHSADLSAPAPNRSANEPIWRGHYWKHIDASVDNRAHQQQEK